MAEPLTDTAEIVVQAPVVDLVVVVVADIVRQTILEMVKQQLVMVAEALDRLARAMGC